MLNSNLCFSTAQFSLPIALTAGIFSMDRNVIPFLPASFGSFVGLVITFGILGLVIHFVPLYQTRCWKVVEDFAGRRRKHWDKKVKVPRIATLKLSTTYFFRRQSFQTDLEQVQQIEPPPSWQVIVIVINVYPVRDPRYLSCLKFKGKIYARWVQIPRVGSGCRYLAQRPLE